MDDADRGQGQALNQFAIYTKYLTSSFPTAMLNARLTFSSAKSLYMDQSTTLRSHRSSITVKYSSLVFVQRYVMLDTHFSLGYAA